MDNLVKQIRITKTLGDRSLSRVDDFEKGFYRKDNIKTFLGHITKNLIPGRKAISNKGLDELKLRLDNLAQKLGARAAEFRTLMNTPVVIVVSSLAAATGTLHEAKKEYMEILGIKAEIEPRAKAKAKLY